MKCKIEKKVLAPIGLRSFSPVVAPSARLCRAKILNSKLVNLFLYNFSLAKDDEESIIPFQEWAGSMLLLFRLQ